VAWIIDRRRTSAPGKRARAIAGALLLDVTVADDEPRSGDPPPVFAFASGIAGSPENADNRAGLRANSCMTVHRFSMTNILEIKRERLFAAMTREESDASLARAGAQGRYLPAHRHACHQAFARKGGKSLIDRAEVAARAKNRFLQDGRRFEMIGPMAQPLHAMRGSL
jgi:hypothetical protein